MIDIISDLIRGLLMYAAVLFVWSIPWVPVLLIIWGIAKLIKKWNQPPKLTEQEQRWATQRAARHQDTPEYRQRINAVRVRAGLEPRWPEVAGPATTPRPDIRDRDPNDAATYNDQLIHRTARGEAVRSKSEIIIANLLYAKGIDYRYEEPLEFDGIINYPDFTIEDNNTGKTYYWEHLGMLNDQSYRWRWNEKITWYKKHGVLPRKEGGGPMGTLVITRDFGDGGIDSGVVSRLIDRLFSI